MPDIVATTTDGFCKCDPQGSFEGARDHAGSSYTADSNRNTYTVGSLYFGMRGTFVMYRSYYAFNCGDISVAPESATLKIHGVAYGSANVIAVKSAAEIELHSSDYRDGLADVHSSVDTALTNSAGDGSGTLASITGFKYMDSPTSSWSTSGYNNLALNADALADMASLVAFKVCVMEYDHDFLDVENTTGVLVNGNWWADSAGSRVPTLSYVAATAAVTDNATFFGANF